MTYSIVYSSKTGNTKMLADTLRALLPMADCVYFGEPSPEALKAEFIYIGFWTDKGTCDEATTSFLKSINGKAIFLFGTAGYGGDPAFFNRILDSVCKKLNNSVAVKGSYMCQGKMPISVRQRYEKMLTTATKAESIKAMIDNFDKALTHPDARDLEELKKAVLSTIF